MNILWLHSHFLYPTGGTRFIYEVVTRLSKQYDITIGIEDISKEWSKKYKSQDIKIKKLSSRTSVDLSYWLMFPYYLRKEINALKNIINKYDVVIASMFPMNYLVSYFNKPYIYFCFEPFAFFYDKSLQDSLPFPKRLGSQLLKYLYQGLDKKGISSAQKIITINNSVDNWMKKIYHLQADSYCYMGVDTNHFSKKKVSKPSKWQGRKLIFHSTDFTAMKGTHYLIKALPYIVKDVPNMKLIISNTVSDKNVINKYKKLIFDNKLNNYVEFIGTLSYADLPNYYSFTDVAGFTADPESIGTTASLFVLESMACQLPVVRSIGCDEEVIHGESGYLADPRKPKEYATFVTRLLKQAYLGQQLGVNARKRVIDFYQWENVASVFRKNIELLV